MGAYSLQESGLGSLHIVMEWSGCVILIEIISINVKCTEERSGVRVMESSIAALKSRSRSKQEELLRCWARVEAAIILEFEVVISHRRSAVQDYALG